MKIKLILFIAIFLLGSMACWAQEAKLDDILSAYYKAIGIEKMKDWQTITGTGKLIGQGMENSVKFYIKRPGKVRVEVEVQGNKMIQVFDGKQGWSIIPWSGSSDPQDMTADDIKGMKNQADIEGTLYNWKEKGHKAELIGKEDFEGSAVYKIKLTKADGDIETYFIDAENYVPLKMAAIVKIQGNETESECYFSNYSEFNGVLMAKTNTNKYKGQTVSTMQLDKMEVNLPVSDSLFVKPVKK
jgi:outer membrane lipoprotein-sorting protein